MNRTILMTVIFGLLVWLLIDNIFQLDIAATKNDALTNSEKMRVENFQNIDTAKTYAKSKLDIIRQDTKRNSIIATKRIWIIIGLISLQLLLLNNNLKKKSS